MKDKKKPQDNAKSVGSESKLKKDNKNKVSGSTSIKRRTKSREIKAKQVYIPLGSTLSLILPDYKAPQAKEHHDISSDSHANESTISANTDINKNTIATASSTKITDASPVLATSSTVNDFVNETSHQNHAQSSHYSHSPVITHPFVVGGKPESYTVATTHAPDLTGLGKTTTEHIGGNEITYREETIPGKYGSLTVKPDGSYTFTLNPKLTAYVLLQGHQIGTDTFTLHLSNGLQQTIAVPVTGQNETAHFSGDLKGSVTEDLNVNSNGLITTQGTLAVSDQDHDQDSLVAVHNQATKYGEFSIDESGHWQYQVNNAGNTVQALSSGQMLQETIIIHSVDGTEQQIVVTINGQDDTAVISGNDLGSVVEDKQPQVSGKLDVTDPDASQQHFQGGDLVGTLGTLHLTDNGAWTYDLDNTNPKVQALAQGAKATDTITVHSADGTSHQVTITVNGTNDAAVIAGTNTGAVTEESQLQTSGTLTVTDVDTGEAHFSNTDITGALGTLHLTDSGKWTYDLDNSNSTVQALGKGATATDTITVHSVDGTPHQVTITVNGTNDKAVIAGTNSGAVTEESQLHTSGTLTVTDVDTGEAHFSNTDIAGALGTLHLTDSGKWTYDLDNTNSTVQALGKGATATDTITVHSADGTPHQVTITVNGTNDAAVIAGTNTGAVTEESQLHTSGTLTVTDVDTGEAHFSNTDIAGTLGTLHLTDSGKWTYDLDNTNPTVQALSKGATATDTITLQSADGTPHQVTITVNGTNDKAVIGGTSSGAVTEESQLQTSGTLTVTDVDTGEAHFSNTDIAGTLGTLYLTDSGKWTYDLDNSNSTVQALSKGATATDTITVHSADGTPHQVTITVNGTNDTAVIAGTDSGAVTEESQLQASGTLTVTDVDTGEAHFSNTDIAGTLGTLHLTDSGSWTYDLDNTNPTVQALSKGATATDTITVHSADGTPHQVTITVNGTNDTAVIAGTDSGAVTEESQLHTSGTLTVIDVDTGEAHFSNTDVVGSLGTLHLTDSGAWTYDLDNSNSTVQALGKGATATDTITVHSADGTPHQVTITINGTNDKAVIGGTSSGAVTEESQLQTSGTLTVTDVDTGEAHFSNTDIAGALGTLHLTDSGKWTYDLNNANPTVQALGKGATATDTITVHSVDGTPHQVTITINGTNDKAVIGGTSSGAVTEESQLQTSGTLTVTDVDTGEAHFSNNDIVGSLGTLHLTDTGGWTYDLDNSNSTVQALGKGATATDTITVHSVDGTPHQVTITINGTNDKAVIGGTSSGAVTEESQLQASGTLTVTDVDTGEAHFSNTDIVGSLGTLHLTDSGKWTYDLDNTNSTVQALGKGATATDTITVHSADGTSHQVTITVNGNNDKAVIAGTDSGAVTEESQLHTSGTLTVTDVDTGEAHFSNTDIAGALGTLHLTDTGGWTYDLDNTNSTVQALGKGATATDTITVHSADGTSHQVTITVNGTNDTAVIAGTDSGAVTEESQLHTSGTLTVTDVDTGEAHFSNTDIVGSLGTLHLTDSGKWTYDLDNTNSTVQALGKGATATDTITVHSADGTPHQVTITVNGTNDTAVIAGTDSGAVTEESQLQASGTLTVTDVDTGEAHFSNTDIAGTLGTLHLTDSGSWTYDLDNTNPTVQALSKGATATDTITLQSADGTPHQVTITVNGTNDKAVIGGTSSGAVTEESQLHTSGTLTVTDVDTGEAHFSNTDIVGSLGTLHLTDTGGWTYDLDNTNPTVQALGKGATTTDTITVHSADGTPHQVTITINGTDDKAIIGGTNTGAVTEESQLHTSGTLTVTDVDTGEAHFSNTDIAGALGTLHLTDSGKWTYDLDNTNPTVQALGKGATTTDTITVHSADGTPHQITITVNGTNDTAVIGGQDTGSVDEGHGHYSDMSPDYGKTQLTSEALYADGKLTIADPDTGENEFDPKGGGYDYQGQYGRVNLHQDGTWHYMVDIGHNGFTSGTSTTSVGTTIDQLGDGQSLTDTITVYSKDGTSHDIVVTIHGDNDRPYISSEVTLATGTEDTALTFTKADLLANTVDVDTNDAGKLSITNLLVDHGSVVDNKDGTYTFTPTNNYNGQVHFSYDVTDAHGGLTHTGATTTLAAVDDKTIISGVNHGVATEDIGTHMSTNVNIMDAVDWQALQITDVDSPNTQVTIEFAGKQYTWDLGSDLDVTTPYGKFQFHTIASGPHQGEHSWSYIGDNNNVHVQELKHGESLTESIKLIATDGTEFPITVKVNGTEDGIIIDSKSELGHVVENAQTGASVSGSVIAHDVDLHDTVSWTQTPTGGVNGQYGTFHLSADGQWHYDVDQSKATKLGDGDEYWEHFTVEAVSTDGSHVSKSVSVVVHGNNDVPTVSGEVTLPSGKEDTSIHITQAELIANATDVDANDRGWLHVQNLTADHGSLVSNSDGSFTFNPDPNYNGAVHFTYDVADRHGGIAHTGANTTLAAVNDAAVFGGVDTGNVTEDHNAHVSVQGNYAYMLEARGTLTATDTDAGESGFDFKTLMTASAHPEWAPYQSKLGGQLEIDQHGNWNYYIDNRKPEVQSLGVSETLTDTVTVNSKDGTSHIITVTIHGTNDAPILNVQQSSNVSGTLIETDLDTNDTHTFSVVSSNGQFGSLSVDPDTGDYVYTPNTSITGMSYNSATNSYHGVDVFEVKVSDGHTEDSKFITFDASGHVTMSPTGGLVISTTVPQQPTVTTTLPTMLMVTNVAPTNSVTLDLASTSDSGSSSTDNLTNDTTPTITGHTDIPFSKVTIYDGSTPVGHAVSDASGQYSVAVSSLSEGDHNLSAKALAPSSTLPATSPALSVHVDTDIAPLQVSLTHDTGSSTSDLITSNGALTISGQEAGATVEYSTDNGHTWTSSFTPQQGANTVSVRQTDPAGNVSASSSLTFTLDNTATAPSVSLTSDSGSSSSDNITNVGDLNIGGIEQGAIVEYSIDNGVHWSTQFTPNEGFNHVQVRQTDVSGNVSPSTSLSYTLDTQTDIRVNSAQVDQHGQGMMVQVYLPKDSEVTLLEISSDGGGAPLLVDLKTVQRQGTGTSVSHPDHQYQEFVGIDLSSLPDGNLSIRVAGTDTAGNTVTAQSSASSNYVLDTTASASDDSNTAIEDSTIPVSGNLLSNDADAATVTTTGDIQGTYGLFHLNKDGSYTYTLDNQLSTIQQLNSTSTPLVDSITYTASDSHGNLATAHLAISIQGTDDNHPPAVTGQTVSTNEDTTKTFTTSEFGYSDQDSDALQFVTISSIPSHGLLLLNGKAVIANQQISKAELDAGHLTFTPINNENGANYAQFTFTANDGHQNSASATMILNVNAVNDTPIVGSSFISSLEDKPHAFTTADFKYSDIDGDALNHITITNVAHGVLTLNGATVNIGDDVSASDISSLIFTPTHNYFSSNINGLGAVQFTANDGHIDSKEGSIFINIADVADPATFGGDSTGATQEDTTLQASGTLTASDPDGTAGFIAVQGGVGIVGSKGYGHAHIDSNGHWTYDLYNKHPIVQQLGQGQTDTETITIQSADGTQHDIVITITGTNDLPTVSEKPQAGHIIGQHSVDEDSNLNPAGQLIINDVDGDTTSVALDPTHSAAYGHVVFDAHSGTWVYNLDNSNPTVNALNDNDTLQDKFTLLVDDGHGQKVPQEITMTINGHTDPVPYAPPTISVTVDTRHAHHVTAGITPSTLQAYAHSIGQHATTVSGSHEIKGHGHSDIIIVNGRLHEEAELEGGNDILFLGGRLTDKEIEGGHGSDTLILGAYNRNNAPRLHDHGEKISDGHEEMELESIENIILGDGTVLKGHLPANFPLVTHDHYEVPVNIQAHLSSGDESVSSIRLTHLQQGLTLQSNGHNINANHDGSYTVPANGHLVVVSDRPMNNGHHYFETEVTTHNSVTGVTAVTTEDLQGHIQSHVNPPPPPPPVQHDEPAPEPEVIEVTLYADDDTTHHDLMAGLDSIADDHRSTGSNPYTGIVGLHDMSQTDGSVAPAPAPDLDLLHQADDLAHQHPVDAFIDNNNEEHKPDDHQVLDDEHIQQDLPDVMDLPDHHH